MYLNNKLYNLLMKRYLTFDDVGIIPKFNKIASRLQTNISTIVHNKMYNYPLVPANMDTVISKSMLDKITKLNGMAIYHRFCDIDEKIKLTKQYPQMYMSVGISEEEKKTIDILLLKGVKNYCIDVAHGHSEQVGDIVKYIRANCQNASIIAGNICTREGYRYLVECGADVIKAGVGAGGCCVTRMKTGFGIPQFSAIVECNKEKMELEKEGKQSWLIADGGIKNPRDVALSIGAGADMVMMGSIFAKTFDSAGKKYIKNNNSYELIDLDKEVPEGKIYSHYRGQASHNFMKSYYGDKKNRVAEGVDFYTECIGPVEVVIDEYSGSLRSSLTYCGAENLKTFKNNIEFFESTSSYMPESNYRNI
jgi:IMP dehydrogenase